VYKYKILLKGITIGFDSIEADVSLPG